MGLPTSTFPISKCVVRLLPFSPRFHSPFIIPLPHSVGKGNSKGGWKRGEKGSNCKVAGAGVVLGVGGPMLAGAGTTTGS